MQSHTTAAVLQYVELYSFLVRSVVPLYGWEIRNVLDINTIWYKTA